MTFTCLYCLPEVIARRATGHFFILIENDIHLIMCICGPIWESCGFIPSQTKYLKVTDKKVLSF